MMMLVDLLEANESFDEIRERLIGLGAKMNLSIRIQREEIFMSMHQV